MDAGFDPSFIFASAYHGRHGLGAGKGRSLMEACIAQCSAWGAVSNESFGSGNPLLKGNRLTPVVNDAAKNGDGGLLIALSVTALPP